MTEVEGLNAQIENNVRVFNAQEAARVEELNEQRRQSNLQQLQSVSAQIGELASNPADVGKLAGFLRSGRRDAISSAIARGENAITDESLLGLRGLLGAREGLQQGPTQALGNFIDADLIDVPVFDTPLGEVPDIDQIYNEIAFDPSGIERGASQPAVDYSQYYQEIGVPPEIQAQLIAMPPEQQAQFISMPEFADGVGAIASPPSAGESAAPPLRLLRQRIPRSRRLACRLPAAGRSRCRLLRAWMESRRLTTSRSRSRIPRRSRAIRTSGPSIQTKKIRSATRTHPSNRRRRS